MIKELSSDTFWLEIYIAGDIQRAKAACSRYATAYATIQKIGGACVSLEETDFIYTGGTEKGVKIRFVNYPRIPWGKEQIRSEGKQLALHLMMELDQLSVMLMDPEKTTWLSRREYIEELRKKNA